MPNVGKSTTFNLMCNMSVAAENFPVCRHPASHRRPPRTATGARACG